MIVWALIVAQGILLAILWSVAMYAVRDARLIRQRCSNLDLELCAVRAAAAGLAWTFDSRRWSKTVQVVAELRDKYEALLK